MLIFFKNLSPKLAKAMTLYTLFLDCDDTLYSNDWRTANGITELIESYCVSTLGLAPGRAYDLYKAHGTCLAGLLAESIPVDVEAFLAAVHPSRAVLAETIRADPALRSMLERIDRTKVDVYVFTASSSQHCANCLSLLAIDDVLLIDADHAIIDCRAVATYGASGDSNDVVFRTKHDPEAFATAQRLAKQPDPSRCYLVDDSWSNMRAAAAAGWHPVLVGSTARDGRSAAELPEKELVIDVIAQLESALPHLFIGGVSRAT